MTMPTVLEALLDHDRGDVDADEIARLRERLAAGADAVQGDAAETSVGGRSRRCVPCGSGSMIGP